MVRQLVRTFEDAAIDDTISRHLHLVCRATTSAPARTGSPRTPPVLPAHASAISIGARPFEAHRLVAAASQTIEVPVVCAVRGWAAGLGCHLALAADFTIATTTARFWEPFGRRGFTPDSGGTWMIPRLVGLARARKMILLGREVSGDRSGVVGAHPSGGARRRTRDRERVAAGRARRGPHHCHRAGEVLPAPLARAPARSGDGARGAGVGAVVSQRRLQGRPSRVPVVAPIRNSKAVKGHVDDVTCTTRPSSTRSTTTSRRSRSTGPTSSTR